MREGDDRLVRVFATTRWSLVLNATRRDSPEADRALAVLCRLYWYPLFAHIRRFGHDPDAAQDLTQEFFARLPEPESLGGFVALGLLGLAVFRRTAHRVREGSTDRHLLLRRA